MIPLRANGVTKTKGAPKNLNIPYLSTVFPLSLNMILNSDGLRPASFAAF